MSAVAETLISGIKDVLRERMVEISNKYMPRINNFYQQAAQITNITSQTLQPLMMNNSIFEAMKKTQIREEDLNITAGIQQARDLMTQQQAEKQLMKINSLLGEGYSILTELGEELRGREIKYMITYASSNGTQSLVQRVIGLKDFTSTFSLGQGGKISFAGINDSMGQKEKSFINEKQWRRLLFFQKTKQRERMGNLSEEELTDYINLYRIQRNKEIIQSVIKDKSMRRRIYREIGRGASTEDVVQNVIKTANLSYNMGRLIELGAGLINQRKSFNLENMSELYEEDRIAFYKQGDFILNGIEYQSKLSNATVNLSTIINGMKKLTVYFSNFYNDTSQVSSQASSDGNSAEEKAYALLEKELLEMFTI